VAQDGETLDVQHGELAGLVEREGVAGEGGDAEAGEDGLLDGFVAAQFQARAEGDATFGEVAFDGVAGAGAFFAHQPGLSGQLFQRDFFLVRQRGGRARRARRWVVHDGGGDDVDVFRRLAEEIQVVQVVGDAGQHLFLVGDAQGHVDARIQLDDFAQQARREIGGGGDRHQAEFALLESAPFVHRHGVVVEDAEDFAGGQCQLLAVGGEVDLLADLLDRRRADHLGQFFHLHGNGGLAERWCCGCVWNCP
jgi:hypothetical protein